MQRLETRLIALAAVVGLISGLIGCKLAAHWRSAKQTDLAARDAEVLSKTIQRAVQEIDRLAWSLRSARRKLARGSYPDDEARELGSINIPFGLADLTGTNIEHGAEVGSMLIDFARGSQAANDHKKEVREISSDSQRSIAAPWSQQELPKVRWGAYFDSGPHGPWLTIQLLPEPFQIFSEWPGSFTITRRGMDHRYARYLRGDPTRIRSGDSPRLIPVNPESESLVCPSDELVKLQRELRDLELRLLGTDEKLGLLDLGRVLHARLERIARRG